MGILSEAARAIIPPVDVPQSISKQSETQRPKTCSNLAKSSAE
jgi:hypothetical protein